MLDKTINTPDQTVERAPEPEPVTLPSAITPSTPGKVRPRLSLHEDMFCRAYLANGGNATQAVKQIWPDSPSPTQRAARLSRRLRWRIRELVDRRLGQYQASADRVVGEIAAIAFDADTHSTSDRLRALETLAKLQGLDRNSTPSAPQVAVQINLAGKDAHIDVETPPERAEPGA